MDSLFTRTRWLVALACIALALGGCVTGPEDSNDASSTTTTSGTTAIASEDAPSTSHTAAQSTTQTTSAVTTTTKTPAAATTTTETATTVTTTTTTEGMVTIRSGASSYSSGDKIKLVVTNGLKTPISTTDQQGFCTIVQIDQLEDGSWVRAAPCLSGPPPIDVVLAAGSVTTVELPQPLEPGEYRARLVYSIGSSFVAGQALEAQSARFTVH